jgi:hypothetical protein
MKTITFLIEIEGKYKEFRLTFKNGVFELKDETLKHTIRFGVGLGDMFLRIHPRTDISFMKNLL